MNTLSKIMLNEVKFDGEQFSAFVKGITDPLTTQLLWLVPVLGVITIIVSAAKWMMLSDDEKERQPYTKTLKKIIIVTAIAESASVIMKMFGL